MTSYSDSFTAIVSDLKLIQKGYEQGVFEEEFKEAVVRVHEASKRPIDRFLQDLSSRMKEKKPGRQPKFGNLVDKVIGSSYSKTNSVVELFTAIPFLFLLIPFRMSSFHHSFLDTDNNYSELFNAYYQHPINPKVTIIPPMHDLGSEFQGSSGEFRKLIMDYSRRVKYIIEGEDTQAIYESLVFKLDELATLSKEHNLGFSFECQHTLRLVSNLINFFTGESSVKNLLASTPKRKFSNFNHPLIMGFDPGNCLVEKRGDNDPSSLFYYDKGFSLSRESMKTFNAIFPDSLLLTTHVNFKVDSGDLRSLNFDKERAGALSLEEPEKGNDIHPGDLKKIEESVCESVQISFFNNQQDSLVFISTDGYLIHMKILLDEFEVFDSDTGKLVQLSKIGAATYHSKFWLRSTENVEIPVELKFLKLTDDECAHHLHAYLINLILSKMNTSDSKKKETRAKFQFIKKYLRSTGPVAETRDKAQKKRKYQDIRVDEPNSKVSDGLVRNKERNITKPINYSTTNYSISMELVFEKESSSTIHDKIEEMFELHSVVVDINNHDSLKATTVIMKTKDFLGCLIEHVPLEHYYKKLIGERGRLMIKDLKSESKKELKRWFNSEKVVIKVYNIYSVANSYNYPDYRTGLRERFPRMYRTFHLNEVECYKKISRYNDSLRNRVTRKMKNKLDLVKFNIPRLLAHGHELKMKFGGDYEEDVLPVHGFFLITEFLSNPGDLTKLLPLDKKIIEHAKLQIQVLVSKIGIIPESLCLRNMLLHDNEIYFIDFERSWIGGGKYSAKLYMQQVESLLTYGY
jgi:hypothetical protein